jgi:multidrug resistance efflux pump
MLAVLALIVVVGALPVRESVLAPAEIVPVDPAPIRAPFDGVVGALHVVPNQPVHAGQVLVSLDKDQLQMRYAVAVKALDMAQAQYGVAAQEAMNSPKASSEIEMLASKVQQQKAEADYDKSMLNRADLVAPADGIAVFDDSNQWIGKPVATGERIMLVASPRNTQLEVQVPAADIVTFATGSTVLFFNNVAPDHPAEGKLTFASYSSAMTAEGVLAYAFRARLDPGKADELRLGLKGTAKIYGPRRALALWMLRRPIALVREWLSL